MKRWNRVILTALLLTGCILEISTAEETREPTAEEQHAAREISEAALRGHIGFLADDLLEGRGPGSTGDALATRYLAAQFEAMGLQPAAADSGWYQTVPLIGVTTRNPPTTTFTHADDSITLQHYQDFILNAGHPAERLRLTDADLVFVGYGIEAPEYQWNDYKGVDLRGKVLLMLNNDPADDPERFAGKTRLYYGRWDYKYESAARQGAAGALIIHTTESAGYPYQVVQTSWSGEEFELPRGDAPALEVRGWVTEEAARKLVAITGKDLDQLREAAQKPDFHPVPLDTQWSVELSCEVREQQTRNVVARLEGSDPELKQQAVLFMAHHDHLGIGQRDERGDNIYNGAVDNASGTAGLLAIARACTSLPTPPPRSLLFVAVGAEEQGLLGSEYFAAHPPIPVGNMACVINIDGVNTLGRTRDVNVIGRGKSDLDQIVDRIAKWQGRVVTGDLFPDRGYYYRSDQFSLAKVGVPGVYLHSGVEVIGKPEGWGREQLDRWVQQIYHQPSDEYSAQWKLEGAVEDLRLLFFTGMQTATTGPIPAWRAGDEFEAARLRSLQNP